MVTRIVFFVVLQTAVLVGSAADYSYTASSDIIGELRHIALRKDDNLLDIARVFGIGYQALRDANPDIDQWIPSAGDPLILPTMHILPNAPRRGVVVNMSEYRLYYYPKHSRKGQIFSFPIGIGKEGSVTPELIERISEKRKDPVWRPPQSIRDEYAAEGNPLPAVVKAGPDNPLGPYAMRIGPTAYLIHGTNKPYGIGMRVSHGCMRLYNEDIELLFRIVPIGTPVRIVRQPFKFGQMNGILYLEAHPIFEEQLSRKDFFQESVISSITQFAEKNNFMVDWVKVNAVFAQERGIPSPIGVQSLSVH